MAKQQLLTTRQIMAGFSVSDMTIYSWRAGTTTRAPLPVVQEGRNVFFDAKAMKEYAKSEGLKFDLAAAEAVKVGGTKPGPKDTSAKPVPAKGKAPAKAVIAKKAASKSTAAATKKAAPAGKKVATKKPAAKKAATPVPFADAGSATTAALH